MAAKSMIFLPMLLAGASAKTPISPPGWPSLPFPFSTAVVSYAGAIHISGMQVCVCACTCACAANLASA